MPNTDAESVDDIVAASNSDGNSAKCMLVHAMPDRHQMNIPVNNAVSSTPTVDSITPGAITGRIEDTRVDRPPEKRITHSATMPMNCAVCISLNWMPSPSTPNPIPTSRNINSKGNPMR